MVRVLCSPASTTHCRVLNSPSTGLTAPSTTLMLFLYSIKAFAIRVASGSSASMMAISPITSKLGVNPNISSSDGFLRLGSNSVSSSEIFSSAPDSTPSSSGSGFPVTGMRMCSSSRRICASGWICPAWSSILRISSAIVPGTLNAHSFMGYKMSLHHKRI